MRTQWQLLIGLFVINLAVGLVMGLALPGTDYVGPAITQDAADYEEHFNGTSIMDSWEGTPFSGIPIIGDIYAGLTFLWNNIKYIVDGLPMLLDWIRDSYITEGVGRTAFDVISGAIRAIYAFLIAIFVIELISGRYMSD